MEKASQWLGGKIGFSVFFDQMSPYLILGCIGGYFLLLILISFLTGKESSNESFFLGKRQSPWYIVAFGMIGASLSGVTFISVPGWVANSQFAYMQMVLGYLAGYLVIGTVLLPLYYRLNLTSIYTYLEQRFGTWSYKTGAAFFLISRIMGASFRLYLVAIVLQTQVFDRLGETIPAFSEVPFVLTVVLTIALIWLYTFRGGIKTIIWTDTLQTLFMLLSVGITVWLIASAMELDFAAMVAEIDASKYSRIWFFDDWNSSQHFLKQFIGGAFIAIAMTGLDQDMMQKNLSCKSLGDAQKNMFWFSLVLVVVNLVFLSLGALLYLYADQIGLAIPEKADQLFPTIALGGYLAPVVGVLFVLGLIAAAYSSADSALTALTTSVCVDFLDIKSRPQHQQVRLRQTVHVIMSLVLVLTIVVFEAISNDSVIAELFTAATFTYGPLLGLYMFGLSNRRPVRDAMVPVVCVAAPVVCYLLKVNSPALFNGYQMGFELLPLNGAITFVGLWLLSSARPASDGAVLDYPHKAA